MKIKDFILNGQAHGSVAGLLLQSGFDPGMLRPFIGKGGRTYVTLCDGMKTVKRKKRKVKVPNYRTAMLSQATGTLIHDEWIEIDRAVVKAAQPRLEFFNAIRGANTVTIPNGLGTTVYESSMIGDISPAEVNMDGLAIADQDRPLMDLTGIPLPIIHKDFSLSLRQVAVSRKSGYPLDTSLPVDAAIKVAQEVEKLTVGIGINYSFAGRHLYGAINFPDRLTVELSDPEAPGWTGKDLLSDVLKMKQASVDVGYNGPWRMFVGSGWDTLLDMDYSDAKGDNTLRERILRTRGIQSIDSLDYMPRFDIILIQMDPRVARAVIAMPLTTLQWEQQGGMEIRLKVMTIMVPQFRADFYGGTGLVHGSVGGSGS